MSNFNLDKTRTESHDGEFKVGSFACSGGNGDSYPYKVLGFNRSGKQMLISRLHATGRVEDRRIKLEIADGTFDRNNYIIHDNGMSDDVYQTYEVADSTEVVKSYKYGWGRNPITRSCRYGQFWASNVPSSSRNPHF
jgi:hypothetical protein